jgi:tyrosine-protein phosphatase YwqE
MFSKVTERLLKEGEVDFIATDTHGSFRSCAGLAEIQARIETVYGQAFVETLMVINPGKVIRNEGIKKRR